MSVNPRKKVNVRNRTNYFDPAKDRVEVSFLSDKSYRYRESKIESYENRLFWEFRYCREHDGQTFFYTFTYNDSHLPHFDGIPCFDYNDLIYLLNGGLKKRLLRDYGTNFRYFVGAELGDGKGERGMHNNPHYHILFFLRPAEDSLVPYKKISSFDFRRLCRVYWQGFDQDIERRDFRSAKFGIVKEGLNLGLVSDFRAISYVSKYVTKDAFLVRAEKDIFFRYGSKFYLEYFTSAQSYLDFFVQVLNPRYNIPTKPLSDDVHNQEWLFDDVEFFSRVAPKTYSQFLKYKKNVSDFIPSIMFDCLAELGIFGEYVSFCRDYSDRKAKEVVNLFRNRYSNKCRISHGVGEYALEFIQDILKPRISVETKDGIKNRPIGLYYYRKLYTDVVKDSMGNNLYVLNELGVRYKLSRLPEQIERLSSTIASYVSVLDAPLFDRMCKSTVNVDVDFSYQSFLKFYEPFKNGEFRRRLFRIYAEYKLVYEGRFFRIPADRGDSECNFPDIDVFNDYKRFLVPSIYTAPYNPFGVIDFLDSGCEGYISYNAHPYFLPYIRVFAVFDLLADYFFCETDELAQQKAEEIAKTKRFHTQLALKQFYSQFK